MSEKFKNLIAFLTRLPGMGPRHATRLILAMLDWSKEDIEAFSGHIASLASGPTLCQQCFNFADDTLCEICKNPKRTSSKIAVVEKVTDLASMEKAGVYDGLYHVLGGAINPANGILPEKLKVRELIQRLKLSPAQEIILATNPNTYGETTALYLEQELRPLNIKITRLGRGLAAGTSVEYADELTLASALKHRK